jgi:hypothetical protein
LCLAGLGDGSGQGALCGRQLRSSGALLAGFVMPARLADFGRAARAGLALDLGLRHAAKEDRAHARK